MKLLVKTFSILSLLALLWQSGCGSARPHLRSESASAEYQQILERINGIVGNQLDLNKNEVDVNVPLSKQKKPADELDVVEIIMNIEEAFDIEIQDEEAGKSLAALSVKELADIVSKKKSLK